MADIKLLELIAPAFPWTSIITDQRTRGFAERARRTQGMTRAGSVLTEQSCSVEIFGHGFSPGLFGLAERRFPSVLRSLLQKRLAFFPAGAVLTVPSGLCPDTFLGFENFEILGARFSRRHLVVAEFNFFVVFTLADFAVREFFYD
jgi:hypothetical protein